MALKVDTEVRLESNSCVIAWDTKLFVGTEDGSVKVFDGSLGAGPSWTAHTVQLFALAAGGGNVYTSSNDSGVRVWSQEGEKIAELQSTGADVETLHVFGNELYTGDEAGNVAVYENNQFKAVYNLLEEVKDLWFSPPFLFTVRDLDVTVTEIKPDESRSRFTTRHTMEGRAPIRVVGNKLLIMARGGNNLELHDASIETRYKKLQEVKVSDMIVTSLATYGDYAWTGGWDGHVRRWRIAGDVLEPAGELALPACINSLATATPDTAYAALANGTIAKISAV